MYRAILADPPWQFKSWSAKGTGRSAEQHYKVMSLEDIKNYPIQALSEKDCMLFLWSVNSMLPEALEVITAWGFKYKTVAFTWVKTTKNNLWHYGMGYYTRQNTEQCLLATKGKPNIISHSVKQLIVEQVREHSRKPDNIYSAIEKLTNGPYIELFARQKYPGWDALGNEVNKFNLNERRI